jgi:hypothetical protein
MTDIGQFGDLPSSGKLMAEERMEELLNIRSWNLKDTPCCSRTE